MQRSIRYLDMEANDNFHHDIQHLFRIRENGVLRVPLGKAPEGSGLISPALRVLGWMALVFFGTLFMGFCYDIGLSR